MNEISIVLNDISVSYGEINALKHINLELFSGTIHAIVGEHGAGKSSIGNILCGMVRPNSGNISIYGHTFDKLTPPVAIRHGIRIVDQDLAINPYFTVAEALYYCDKTVKKFSWNYKHMLANKAKKFLEKSMIDIDENKLVKHLNLSEKAIVSFLAQTTETPRILILDETLDKISTDYYPRIFDRLKLLKKNGTTILIITHKIDRIYELANRITIIKNGENIFTDEVENITKIQTIKMAYTQHENNPIYQNQVTGSFYELIKYNEAILVALPVNLVIVNNKLQIKLINNYFKDSFSINPDDYIHTHISTLLNGTHKVIKEQLFSILNTGKDNEIYHTEIHIAKTEGIFNIQVSPILDDTDRIGMIIIFENITDYDAQQKNTFLNDKLSSIGMLAAGVAHEINNPLEIISNYLTNIRLRYGDSQISATLDKLENEVKYITGIVSNLQNFSSTNKIIPEVVDINNLFMELFSLLNINAKLKNISLEIISDEKEHQYVYVNENELKQAILNIIKNSFEAMSEKGGRIITHIKREKTKIGSNISIEIIDEGKGIDEGKDLFIPFYSTKSSNGRNTGLGLSIVFGIIKKYNGVITLKNRKDGTKGCVTKILFPCIEEAMEEIRESCE
jgi:ABC-type multidrug transport system ATPase subunit